MSRVVMHAVVSVDGYLADPDDERLSRSEWNFEVAVPRLMPASR